MSIQKLLQQIFTFRPSLRVVYTSGSLSAGQTEQRGWIYFAGGDQNQKDTQRAQRRRRADPAPPQGRERAEAPQRRRPAVSRPQQPPAGGTGGGERPPSMPALPLGSLLGGGRNMRWLVLVIIIVFVVISMLGSLNGGEEGDLLPQPPAQDLPALPPAETQPRPAAPAIARTQVPFTPPVSSAEGQTWLVMLYQDADDKILEQDIYVDLNEAERVGSSERVHIVAQVDRYRAGYQGDGDWTAARRYYVTQDNDLNRIRSQQLMELGEVNMSDAETLVDFVNWAVENFPADKHVLILSDHGMGWPGGWSDPEPGGPGDRSIPLAARLGDQLYLMELDEALGEIRAQSGISQFELIGMDACLMGHAEVFSALAPHARYAVASQETEPALGWAYTGFLEALTQDPDMDGAALSQLIVDSYIQDDQRIVDEQARAEFLRQGSSLGGLFGLFGGVSADQLAEQLGRNITLTAVDLATIPELLTSLNELAFSLQTENQQTVAQARSYAQSFTSVFGSQVPPSYIDLGNFVQMLKRQGGSRQLDQAVDLLLASIDKTVIAEKHGSNKPGASGVSIYFPNSQLYGSAVTGAESYTAIANRFAQDSLWDDFLAFHYTGRGFEAAPAVPAIPAPGVTSRSPAQGQIQVSEISLSSDQLQPGETTLLSMDIQGENIGYIYLFVGYLDAQSNSILVADMDYLESAETIEVQGVYYPDWGDGSQFTLEFEWEPVVFAVNDGVDNAVALFSPEQYGLTFEQAVYTVEGIYTYAEGGESRYARLYFQDGTLRNVYGFTGEDGTGAPREIVPQVGDSFTILDEWMDLDQSGNVVETAYQEGATLVFSEQTFTWETLDAAPGEYIVGFIVTDLDGVQYPVYTQVTVR